MVDVGARIGEKGWRQGSILRDDDLFLCRAPDRISARDMTGAIGVVVSQSCDLTHAVLEGEPVVEILVGHPAEDDVAARKRGNCSGGKHPRCLHMTVQMHDEGERWFEFTPWSRVAVDRSVLVGRRPDADRFISPSDMLVLTNWLAQRYIRAAFPDDFNALLDGARSSQRKLYARLSSAVSGLHARLLPDRDLLENERYTLDLLALVPDLYAAQLASAAETVEKLADVLRSAGIDVSSAAVLESEVSYARVRSFRRFPLEHLSLRGDPPDPMPLELSAGGRRG